jgi:hypothetical protein
MKIIMTFIVTMTIATLGLHANTPQVDNEFTVTQIALDTATENEAAINQALEAITEDKNISNEGGETEKK